MVGISTGFVCLGQELSVYHTLSWTILVDIIHGCVCLGQYRFVHQPVLSVMDKLVGISSSFVCRGQNWLE